MVPFRSAMSDGPVRALPVVVAERQAGALQAEGRAIKLENAPLDKIIRFVASVQEAKNSIRIENFEVRRAARTRSGAASDSWTADVALADYSTKKPTPGGS